MKIKDIEIKGIASHSNLVKPGFVFVAIKGSHQDGNRFIAEAISRGARVVVMQKSAEKIEIPGHVKVIVVDDCRKFLAEAANRFYGFPSSRLKVAGITGTNGKTTISCLIESLARESGYGCGVIGTINYRFKGRVIEAKNTTPGCLELQSLLSQMHIGGSSYCAMEVSSHALDQGRVEGINFRRAIFTNLTQDHLDYHKNLEKYFLAKARLFCFLSPSKVAIINNDDRYGRRIKLLTKARIQTYGIQRPSTFMAKDISFGLRSTEFTLFTPEAGLCAALNSGGQKIDNEPYFWQGRPISLRIKTRLVGRYNIYNVLAAVAWGVSERLNLKDIQSAVEKFQSVPGRLEEVSCEKGFNVFVDYAHTPDALFNVISALRPLVKGRIIVIFGCGGERDKLKRPKMGKVAAELADYAIITSDNPRSENPSGIIRDICSGIIKKNYCLKPDRFEAIRAGLGMAKKDDCLLIAGKGHENYQILKDKVLRFSDQEVVRECLKSMK